MAAIHLEDCPGVFSRLPCTSILGWPVLWRLIFCLLLPTVVSAQEVYLPDVTTVIAGEELEVAEDNLRAIRLYEKLGFAEVCRLPAAAVLEDGTEQTLLTMRKEM